MGQIRLPLGPCRAALVAVIRIFYSLHFTALFILKVFFFFFFVCLFNAEDKLLSLD